VHTDVLSELRINARDKNAATDRTCKPNVWP
jgi:hypothetical protein